MLLTFLDQQIESYIKYVHYLPPILMIYNLRCLERGQRQSVL